MNNEDSNTRQKVIDVLNRLVAVNYNGRDGYRTAAEAVNNQEYVALFEEYAEQRAGFIEELKELIIQFGGKPENEGNLSGVFHRAWIDLKGAITNGDAASIMAECDRSEATALEVYREAMGVETPEPVREVIRRHMSAIRLAHERVHALNTALQH